MMKIWEVRFRHIECHVMADDAIGAIKMASIIAKSDVNEVEEVYVMEETDESTEDDPVFNSKPDSANAFLAFDIRKPDELQLFQAAIKAFK